MEDVVWLPVWPEGFGKNGVRGRENTGSEKASGVCVASEFKGATALCLKLNLLGTPGDKVKEGSLSSAHKRLGGTDRWVRWRGNWRAEVGHWQLRPPSPAPRAPQ